MARPERTQSSDRPALVPALPLPDRSLDPDSSALPIVRLRGAGHRMLVFKKMVYGFEGPTRPRDGDLVRVIEPDGRPAGFGLWNSQSQYAIRMISRQAEPPDAAYWAGRLGEAVGLRRQFLGLDEQTTAYRVVHAEGDGLPGLIADRYGPVVSVELFSLGLYQRIGPILELLRAGLGTEHYRVRIDPDIARAEGFHPRPLDSEGLADSVTVTENGVRFRVHFESGHKTGFFCDQRENRRSLRAYCAGQDVLDLCTYSGGFAVNAALHGARRVTAVDLDEDAVAMARANANLNQVRLELVHADAFGYARQMSTNGRSFGVVVVDPPKFIPTRADTGLGQRKYLDLNTLAMKLVEPGGVLVTCSCSGLLDVREFQHIVRTAAWRAGRTAQLLAITGASADHPVRLDAPEGSYLKLLWLRVGERSTESDSATVEDAGLDE
jgi:23S rRNA (cytosine1962-C5)-methyltransferase